MTVVTHGKLKLMQLTERTSAKGTRYLTGILGRLSVIGFHTDQNEWGETWDVFLQERQQKRGASRISVIFYGSSLYAILPWR